MFSIRLHFLGNDKIQSSEALMDFNLNPLFPFMLLRFGTWMVTITTASFGNTSLCMTS